MFKTGKKCFNVIFASLLLITLISANVFTAAAASDLVTLSAPKAGSVYYIGEKIKLKMTVRNPFIADIEAYNCWCRPSVTFHPANGTYTHYDFDALGESKTFSKSISTNTFKAGKCDVTVTLTPTIWGSNSQTAIWEQVSVNSTIVLKKLPTPKSLKVKAGTGKAIVSWSKVAAADKYIVYRSADDYGLNYKKIGTSTTAKYVDKTAKKGKQYYYKVVSCRNGAKSEATGAKRSAKIG